MRRENIDYQSQLETFWKNESDVHARRKKLVELLETGEVRVVVGGFSLRFEYVRLPNDRDPKRFLHRVMVTDRTGKIGYVNATEILGLRTVECLNKGFLGEKQLTYGKWGVITLATGLLVQALQSQGFVAFSGTIEAGNRSSWRSRLKVMDLTAGGFFPVEAQLLSHHAPKKTYVVRSNIDPEVRRLSEPMTLGEVLINEKNAREGKK